MKKEKGRYLRKLTLSKKNEVLQKLRLDHDCEISSNSPRGSDSLVNAMGDGDYPSGIDQHTAAPVADEAQFWMQQLKGYLPRPRALPAGFAVEDATGGRGGGGGGNRRRGRDVVL